MELFRKQLHDLLPGMQLLPEDLQLGLQLAGGYLLYPLPGSLSWSPLEELVHHGQVFLQEESGAEEEALELERLTTSAQQPGSASQLSEKTRRSDTGRDTKLVFTSLSMDRAETKTRS